MTAATPTPTTEWAFALTDQGRSTRRWFRRLGWFGLIGGGLYSVIGTILALTALLAAFTGHPTEGATTLIAIVWLTPLNGFLVVLGVGCLTLANKDDWWGPWPIKEKRRG